MFVGMPRKAGKCPVIIVVLSSFLIGIAGQHVETPHRCLPDSTICFTVITETRLSWTAAKQYCRDRLTNGDLVAIHNAFHRSIIAAWLPLLFTDPWIGAIQLDPAEYIWTDGSHWDYSYWSQGQPVKKCGQICHEDGAQCQQGHWTTADCNDTAQFICEYRPFEDCWDLHTLGGVTADGIYSIRPLAAVQPFDVYCDMTTDGGGWTMVQRRFDGRLPFWNRTWSAYKQGFSNGLNNSLWIGNDHLHLMSTKDPNVDLRIDLWGDRAPNAHLPYGYWTGTYKFMIKNEAANYTMIASVIGGNATFDRFDLTWSSNKNFSFITLDRGPADTCNEFQLTGWWLGSDCASVVSLNGKYIPPDWQALNYGLVWYLKNSEPINPRRTEMKLRKVM